ncbi:MAG: flagellar biosynthetic protein FliR [Opitutaceae bacterium]|nr:flagellar biosynthetic protein FliR [Opitutaceae bacterium]
MPIDLVFAWLMVFLRGLGVVLLLPTLAGRPLPVMLRVAMAACLASIMYGMVRGSAFPPDISALIFAAGGEVILGLVFGFIGRLAFAAVELAGRLIANEIGLMAAPGFDVPQPSQEPLPAFLSMFAGVLFFLFGAHLSVLTAFMRSFDLAPAGAPAFNDGTALTLITQTSHVISLGFRIAAPFIALNFLVNLAFSVLGRAVPKMGVFVLSYPLRTLAGFSLLAGAGGLIARYLWTEFDAMPFRILEILPH